MKLRKTPIASAVALALMSVVAPVDEIDNLLQRSALNFGSQRDVLMNIPKKVEERALQIYFW